MKVCDICKNISKYERRVTINPDLHSLGKQLDLCERCFKLLNEKENQHKFLAYKETVEEVTNGVVTTNEPTKKTWSQRLKWMR